ncbi:MAG TPA: hypothetical protein VIU46_07680 [Gallionellaceae bacterium]
MFKYILIIALAAGGGWYYTHRKVIDPTAMLAPNDPVQVDLYSAAPVELNGYKLTPMADFRAEARVLSATSYSSGREADLSPVDLALGWGRMSVGNVIDRLNISQGSRHYFYRWTDAPPIPQQEIITHSANMHMIPANAAIEKQLERVSTDDLVKIEGQLVYIRANDGWGWNSSLRRDDSGDGACEVVLVRSMQIY